MNKIERLEAAINHKAVDRVPYSIWYHLSAVDQDPVSLAEETIALTKKYDYDFVKMMPFGLYGVQDLGAKINIFAQQGKPPLVARPGIQSVSDYLALKPIPAIQGTYGKQLEFASLLQKNLPRDTPYIQTIFSPLTTLHKLAGNRLLEDLKTNPEAVEHALDVITEITIDFVQENIARGVSGFFFATQDARKNLISPENFLRFGEKYDLQVLNSYVKKTWFNVVHLHSLDVYFEEVVRDYPNNVINWHDRNTFPNLQQARQLTDKAFLAGIRAAQKIVNGIEEPDDILSEGTEAEIIAHVREAIAATDGKGLILGPGCVVDQFVSEASLRAVRRAIEL
ncbi:uroporphyrinogen decarboxylase family protein [Phascolarctobacterium sp.]|uniref:uroporphyrinogen decarboxylase family protein n=1 Tax=Phascolarctobacterium sp. TaxID=2049039 RepID=UPI003865795C